MLAVSWLETEMTLQLTPVPLAIDIRLFMEERKSAIKRPLGLPLSIDLCLPLPLKTTRFGTDKDAGPAAWGRRSGPEARIT
jgi:hypothetical protein